jgi:hypothetical protein
VLNFRTSFHDSNGFRENRPKKMAEHYLKGWCLIDVASCLPVGYVQYFVSEGPNGGGENLRSLKAIRLMKMAKLMRLARIKRILTRHGSDVNYQQYFNIAFTIFTIVFVVHLLACFFYLVGEESELLENGVHVSGWVEMEEHWWSPNASHTGTKSTDLGGLKSSIQKPDPVISIIVRYIASMYYVLNSLEAGTTTMERGFGIIAEFTRDIILGLVASLITTISM